ncbi:MAG: L,D-transpeptidase family protein [Hamadaea sp.]|nr:L,D-transpeptidase family protein [Hamadaea sp.]
MSRFRAIVTIVAVTALAASACTSAPEHTAAPGPSTAPAAAQENLALTVTPADRQAGVPISAEVGIKLGAGSVESVQVTDAAGRPVAGTLREDGSGWVPSRPLAYQSTYRATVTAVGSRRHRESQTVAFTTMAQPALLQGVGFYLFNGQEYGVGMPIPVEFLRDVPKNMQAAVQRRFFVTADPPQPGAWHWFSDSQVQYRPATYWKPGTKLTVRLGLKGQALGGGYYGDEDKNVSVRIDGDRVEVKITNWPKQLQLYKNGKLLRTMPVSLGKSSTPSSSGHMVVMEQAYTKRFDTRGEPNGGYVVDVNYAQRLTWGGEFIHSAPWSVGDQGYRNVSHGCVNVGPGNAEWLFTEMKVGTPVTVTGTGIKLAPGNGWTVWDMSWPEFIKGSAVPVAKAVAEATAYDPYPKPAPPSPAPSAGTPSAVPGQGGPADAAATPAPAAS